uniref:Thyroglobulin type-1 domain-containing protein n=1 Tax=Branchiostoma floridae TaxID=7739 RepID=C3YTB2_BRAFL|eukprot:XP_002600467.1 hypothetical protein BRAFLDRAFT_70159 [Branchiostoma floridae]
MAAIHTLPEKHTIRALLLAVCISISLSGSSAQTPGAGTTPVVSPGVGQQSSAAPQGTGAASTAQASPAPQGASTVPPAGSNVTNPPTTVATGKPGACRPNPSPMPGEFVKQCEQDGSFSTKQCHGSTGFCYCAHPQDGTIYQETGRRGSMQHDCATYWKTKDSLQTIPDASWATEDE